MTALTDTAGSARVGARSAPLAAALAWLQPRLGTVLLPFALVLYLALEGGGYDEIVRSEVGVAAWWVVLLGAAVGVLPAARLGRASWIALGALGAFAAWTAVGIGWSESSERSVAEVARVASLLGIFTLALCAQGRDGVRRTASAVGAAIAVVASLALLSRLHPSWFPANEIAEELPAATGRLAYPLNYWNGLAAFIAIGIPLVAVLALRARHLVAQSLATAALPAMATAAFFTFSRGGALEVAVGLAVLLALYPARRAALPTLAVAAVGSGILIAAATQRDALEAGALTEAARSQGDELLAMTLVVCAGVGLLRAAIGLAARHGVGPRVRISPRAAGVAAVTGAVVALVAFIAAGGPGKLDRAWEDFKEPTGVALGTAERFESASGSGRYQWWQGALDANATDPLVGIGPGTFEYHWAREGTIPGFVRDAHSLYLETLAELGVVGLLLVLAAVAVPLAVGARRALRAAPEARAWLAAALAAGVTFAVAAAIDWAWELTVLPVIFLLLAAALLAGGAERTGSRPALPRAPAARAALGAGAVVALVAIAIPLASTASVRDSQAQVRAAQLGPALTDARSARDLQPYASTPALQEALVLELAGDTQGAAAAARQATAEEPTNWRTWLVLSRIEALAGNAEASVTAYREARSLNPRSPLFMR